MSLIMTKQEREAFLSDVHVGIISIAEEGRGPLTVPVWYAYDLGKDMCIMTGRESRKGRLLARVGRFSLFAQTESPPYKYVSVDGPILSTEAADLDGDLRPLARRCLGKGGDRDVEERETCLRNRYHHCPNASRAMADQRYSKEDDAI